MKSACGAMPRMKMADGGQVSPWSIKGIYNKLAGPTETISQKYARQDAEYKAAHPTEPVTAKPASAISNYASGQSVKERVDQAEKKALGMKDGGQIKRGAIRAMRMIDGGQDPLAGQYGHAAIGAPVDQGAAMDRKLLAMSAAERSGQTAPAVPTPAAVTAPLAQAARTGMNTLAGTNTILTSDNSEDPEETNPLLQTLYAKKGGQLQTGKGGAVPGKGKGDTIPAKYTPGEFVVSNDMMKMEPGLQEHLHALRVKTLAAKGMTPAMADAGRFKKGAIRAMTALDPTELAPYVNHRPYVDPNLFQPPLQLGNNVPPPGTALSVQPAQPNFTMGSNSPPQPAIDPVTDVRAKFTNFSPEAKEFMARQARVASPMPTATPSPSPSVTPGSAVPSPERSPSYRAGQAVNKGTGLGQTGAGKATGLGAIAMGSAIGSQHVPTEDYRRRLGMDPNGTSVIGDLAARGAGVVSDFGAKILDTPVDALNTVIQLLGGDGNVQLPGGSFHDYLSQNDNPANTAKVASQQDAYGATSTKPRVPGAGDATMPGQDPARPAVTALATPAMPLLNGQPGSDVAGAPGVSKFVQNGKTLYSNVAGENSTAGKNQIGIVPGMDPALIKQTLTNPDGSRWSATDNAIMAANLRDGIDPYTGTSRAPASSVLSSGVGNYSVRGNSLDDHASTSIPSWGLNAFGKPSRRYLAMKAAQEQNASSMANNAANNATNQRGQDITAASQGAISKLAQERLGLDQNRLGLDQNRLGMEQADHSQKLATAKQAAAVQAEYLAAGDDPVKIKAVMQKMRALGMLKEQPITYHPGQRTKNVDGSETITDATTFNPNTGEVKPVGQGGQANAPTTKAEYDKLAKGAVFTAPDGSRRVKP